MQADAALQDTGKLIETYRGAQALWVIMLFLSLIIWAGAGGVYAITQMNFDAVHPYVASFGRRGRFTVEFSSHLQFAYVMLGFLLTAAIASFATAIWLKRRLSVRYELYEKGVFQVRGRRREFVPFKEIEDVYIFNSGAGMSNIAYRRNSTERFRRAYPFIKRIHTYIKQFNEQILIERLPLVLKDLEAGEAIRFGYISKSQMLRMFWLAGYLKIGRKVISLTRETLDIDGFKVDISTLGSVGRGKDIEELVIKDKAGKTVFSHSMRGIVSAHVFEAALAHLIEEQKVDLVLDI